MKCKAAFLLFFSLVNFSSVSLAAESREYDYLIRNAVIFDGESLKSRSGDVAILGDRIAAVGDLKNAGARKVLDAKGLTLAPGFIDAHTHSDFNPFVYEGLPNKIMQGVTSEVVGNCGMSAAPILGGHGEKIREIWSREGVTIKKPSWQTFAEYKKSLLKKGLSVNFTALTGHGNLRSAVMGYAPRPASESDILEMRKMLKQAMREGSAGISFGLIYLPGTFADVHEITELCREAAAGNGVCAFHMRSEGAQLIESIQEVIRVARKTKARVQISHLKAAGKKNWGKADEAARLITEARREGIEIEADAYPYTATAAELGVLLPDEIFLREDRLDLFRNPLRRDGLLNELRKHYEERDMKWDRIMIASVARRKYRKFEGKTIKQIARETGLEPEWLLIEILADNNFEVSAFNFAMDEEAVAKIESLPFVSTGSDSVADGSRKPHPRAFGTFPRMFRLYLREQKRLSAGELIRKMTSMPADQFRLEGRGRIKPGAYADLVLFDAGDMADLATYEKSSEESAGVRWVFVNGLPVVENGKPNNKTPGRVLAPGV